MYALIGYPLGHSYSADFFNAKFRREGIDDSYRLLPIEDISLLPDLLERYPDLEGFNVTIPYKQAVISYLDDLSEEARAIGAVNVVKIVHRGKDRMLIGYNTDVIGFRQSLESVVGQRRPEALVLGTGGASKAVAYALASLDIPFKFVSRNPSGKSVLTYEQITPEILASHELIVNTTPLGMSPHTDAAPPLDYCAISCSHMLFDLVYNPSATKFLLHGLAAGATVKNGLEMLRLQALAAWEIWRH